MVEGAPLLREYRVKPIEGSNPSPSAKFPLGEILVRQDGIRSRGEPASSIFRTVATWWSQ